MTTAHTYNQSLQLFRLYLLVCPLSLFLSFSYFPYFVSFLPHMCSNSCHVYLICPISHVLVLHVTPMLCPFYHLYPIFLSFYLIHTYCSDKYLFKDISKGRNGNINVICVFVVPDHR